MNDSFYLPLIEDTEYGRHHILRFCRSAQWIESFMENADVLELGEETAFTGLLKRAWPKCSLEVSGNDDLREPMRFAHCSKTLVLCMEIIEHLKDTAAARRDSWCADGIGTMLASAWTVMRPGGRLFLTTPNLACWHSLDRLLNGGHPFFHSGHNREMTAMDVRDYLNRAGFVIERMESLDVWAQHGTANSRIAQLRRAVAQLGCDTSMREDCIFCLARKPLN